MPTVKACLNGDRGRGEQEWAWPVLRWAQDTGLGIRAGFEDMLTGPRGEQVRGNADLLRLALDTKGTTA
jgi:uncharacterized protein (DUF849 family)